MSSPTSIHSPMHPMGWVVVILFYIVFSPHTFGADGGTSAYDAKPGIGASAATQMSDEERLKIEEETRQEILRVTESDPANIPVRFSKFAEVVLLPGVVLMMLIVLVRRGSGSCV